MASSPLKYGLVVVVKTTYEARVNGVGNIQGAEVVQQLIKVSLRLCINVVLKERCVIENGLGGWVFAVQNPQGVRLKASLAVLIKLITTLRQIIDQGLTVAGTVSR